MSGRDLRDKMVDRAAGYEPRYLQPHEVTFLNFVATYIDNEVHQQLLFSILMDYVFRIFFISAASRFPDEKSLKSDEIKRYLKENTGIPDGDIERIQRLLKGALSEKYAGKLKNERKERVREKSTGKCYLCGFLIENDDETEIDHVWPHSLGGKNSGENLRLAHAECAAIKADAATVGDVLTGLGVYGSPPNGLKLPAHELSMWPNEIESKDKFNSYRRNIFSSSMRLAVYMKQDFGCFCCKEKFSDAGETTIARYIETPVWGFLNLNAYCEKCYIDLKVKGILE